VENVGDVDTIVEGVRERRVRAIARAITLVENSVEGRREIVRHLHPLTGNAHIIGIAGPPGVGKSTIVDGLIRLYRNDGVRVGVIAVDPTSPFTGGAILGDRIRMVDHSGDPGVFVRSMGSRGSLGGLALATADAITVLDGAGFDVVFVETVGAGQAEVDIVRTSHTTVVVDVPGLGDDVQVLKAGLMEIGDVFAVNKADLPDADRLVVQIESLLSLVDRDGWVPPVVKTVGHDVTTLVRLREMIDRHRAHEDGDMAASRRRTMADHRVRMLLEARLLDLVMERVGTARYAAVVGGVVSREMDPYTAVQKLVEGAL